LDAILHPLSPANLKTGDAWNQIPRLTNWIQMENSGYLKIRNRQNPECWTTTALHTWKKTSVHIRVSLTDIKLAYKFYMKAFALDSLDLQLRASRKQPSAARVYLRFHTRNFIVLLEKVRDFKDTTDRSTLKSNKFRNKDTTDTSILKSNKFRNMDTRDTSTLTSNKVHIIWKRRYRIDQHETAYIIMEFHQQKTTLKHVRVLAWTSSDGQKKLFLLLSAQVRIFTLLTGSVALRFTATGAPSAERRIRILPLNQYDWRSITFGMK
jgi:hypothetical protein